jgi:hypothetical protein
MAKKTEPKFVLWVRAYGIGRLCRILGLQRQAIQAWIGSGGRQRNQPKMINAKRIVELSKAEPRDIGPLTLEDIL